MKPEQPRLWDRWKQVAARAATFQARILLTIFYWTVIPIFAGAMRLFKSDPLGLDRRKGGRWTPTGRVDPWKQY
jgi:hypothetical protein